MMTLQNFYYNTSKEVITLLSKMFITFAGFLVTLSGTLHYRTFMDKAHKNCIIGQQFCLHHITGTAFIIRLKLNVYIVENSDTFQKRYSFMQFK